MIGPTDSQNITNKCNDVQITYLHKIYHNSDMFRSNFIIFRELLNKNKAYIKPGWIN